MLQGHKLPLACAGMNPILQSLPVFLIWQISHSIAADTHENTHTEEGFAGTLIIIIRKNTAWNICNSFMQQLVQ